MNSSPKLPDVVGSLRKDYTTLNEKRKMLYEAGDTTEMFAKKVELRYRELQSVTETISQLYSLEPNLIHSFVDTNTFLKQLPIEEKQKIVVHLVANMHAIENSYLSWRFSEFQAEDYLVLPNRKYLNMSCAEGYFNPASGCIQGNEQSVYRIFQLSYNCLSRIVKEHISTIKPAYDEFLFLIGLKIYDPSIKNISIETQKWLQNCRDLLIDDMVAAYKKMGLDTVRRIESLLAASEKLEEYANRLREDMLMYRCFSLLPCSNKIHDKIWGICIQF